MNAAARRIRRQRTKRIAPLAPVPTPRIADREYTRQGLQVRRWDSLPAGTVALVLPAAGGHVTVPEELADSVKYLANPFRVI